MLKIYLQVFGSIAVCLIILLNYQVFVQKPNKEKIEEIKAELVTLHGTETKLDQVLEHSQRFPLMEELQFRDYDNVRVFFTDMFNEPKFMGRIQKLVDLSGCSTGGITVGNISRVMKPAVYTDFRTSPSDDLVKSVDTFIQTMDKYTSDPKKWQQIVGTKSVYATRLYFYMEMSAGKKYPASMIKSMEVHKFSLTVKGNYTQCKRFLHLVGRNRPFTRIQVASFVPINEAQGSNKMFTCRTTISTWVDKSEEMKTSAEAKTIGMKST